jgi:hypothetical protein
MSEDLDKGESRARGVGDPPSYPVSTPVTASLRCHANNNPPTCQCHKFRVVAVLPHLADLPCRSLPSPAK